MHREADDAHDQPSGILVDSSPRPLVRPKWTPFRTRVHREADDAEDEVVLERRPRRVQLGHLPIQKSTPIQIRRLMNHTSASMMHKLTGL